MTTPTWDPTDTLSFSDAFVSGAPRISTVLGSSSSEFECVVLPKKGRLSPSEKTHEIEPEFVNLRKQHSAVESTIIALEIHGLGKCSDHGIKGSKPYVALAVVARNNTAPGCSVASAGTRG